MAIRLLTHITCILSFVFIGHTDVCASTLLERDLDKINSQLSSDDVLVRESAAKVFAINAPSFANEGAETLLTILGDEESSVVIYGLYALQRAYDFSKWNKTDNFQYLKSQKITHRLDTLVCNENEEVRLYSAIGLAELVGPSIGLEKKFFRCLENISDPIVLHDTVIAIGRWGPQSEELTNWLYDIASSANGDASSSAIEILAKVSPPDPNLLPLVLKLSEEKQNFAKPSIISLFPNFGEDAIPYLPELYRIQEILEDECIKPPEDRNVTIYVEEFTKNNLVETIEQLESIKTDTNSG